MGVIGCRYRDFKCTPVLGNVLRGYSGTLGKVMGPCALPTLQQTAALPFSRVSKQRSRARGLPGVPLWVKPRGISLRTVRF